MAAISDIRDDIVAIVELRSRSQGLLSVYINSFRVCICVWAVIFHWTVMFDVGLSYFIVWSLTTLIQQESNLPSSCY